MTNDKLERGNKIIKLLDTYERKRDNLEREIKRHRENKDSRVTLEVFGCYVSSDDYCVDVDYLQIGNLLLASIRRRIVELKDEFSKL